ncbi:MAG: DUF2796 domain-containing protein [Comamonadaceae bacterium]|nr:MAG: DUF2796 domain-containing protein [Comamonadaceae bacterium]
MKPLRSTAAIALTLWALAASAQQRHAHVHGLLKLDVAIDGATLTVAIDSPLDNLVGFERAPRSEAEQKTVERAVTQLRNAGALFKIDPAAGCKVGQIDLDAPVLGLGDGGAGGKEAHADLEATITFRCADAGKARFIDVALFDAFTNLRQIDAQIAAPEGQFQRTLKRPNVRLAWGK